MEIRSRSLARTLRSTSVWKMAWGRLHIKVVLSDRGLDLPTIYLDCGMDDETWVMSFSSICMLSKYDKVLLVLDSGSLSDTSPILS